MNAETGAGAIRTMLGMIGEEGATDHDIARLLVSNEQAIRAFLQERDAVTAEIEDWRGRLATQCGETLAARHQRDAATREVETLKKNVAHWRGYAHCLDSDNTKMGREVEALREEVGRLRQEAEEYAESEFHRGQDVAREAPAQPSADDAPAVTDHRFDGGSFGGGDQGECSLRGKDARLHRSGTPSDDDVERAPTTEERARLVYQTIEAFGWQISWRHKKPIPDDAWPVDIIAAALSGAHARGFHAAYARYEKDHRDLVEIMYRERESAKRAEYARGRAEMREALDRPSVLGAVIHAVEVSMCDDNDSDTVAQDALAAVIRSLPDAAAPGDQSE